MIEGVAELGKRLIIVSGEDSMSVQAQANATLLMNILLRSTLCAKQMAKSHKLNQEAFEWLLGEIETRFDQVVIFIHSSIIRSIFRQLCNREKWSVHWPLKVWVNRLLK